MAPKQFGSSEAVGKSGTYDAVEARRNAMLLRLFPYHADALRGTKVGTNQDSEEVRPGDFRRDKSTEKLHDPLAVHLFVVEEDARMGEPQGSAKTGQAGLSGLFLRQRVEKALKKGKRASNDENFARGRLETGSEFLFIAHWDRPVNSFPN